MSLPRSLHVTARTTLAHGFDIEERIASATPADTLKGMFFGRALTLGTNGGFRPDGLRLSMPPTGLRYHAFRDYPVTDYFRLVDAIARALHPNASIAEATRRVAQNDFAEFSGSNIGGVMLAFTGSARSTLAKCGPMYAAVLKGSTTVRTEETSDGVLVRFRGYPGPVEAYPVGTLEGVCRHYHASYEIDVTVLSPTDADYVVRVGR